MNLFTVPVGGYPLWIVLLICVGVFLASFMDAIAGGGGIISVPVYMLGLGNIPTYFILGTNKLSACVGTVFSTARFVRKGFVKWALVLPAVALAILGSVMGTWLQHHTPDLILKYFLLMENRLSSTALRQRNCSPTWSTVGAAPAPPGNWLRCFLRIPNTQPNKCSICKRSYLP